MTIRSFLGLFGCVVALMASATERPRAVQVADRVWFVQGLAELGSSVNRNFISNAAFVVTDDRVVVIDSLGSPVLARDMVAEIRRVTPLPIRHVIVTHYHADHIYGLQVFKALGAEIVAHRHARSYLTSDTAARRLLASRADLKPWIDEQTQVVPADRWLETGMTVEWGGTSFVIEHAGPAHTAEDLVLYLPQRKVLFAGDLVFRSRLPFVGDADSAAWVQALDRLLTVGASIIVPGHGPVSTQPDADLRLTRDYLLHLRQSMAEAARNLEPFEEAYARTDWSRFDQLPLFGAANRINAYNTFLLMEQTTK